jgi:hypothetical protein
MGIFTIITLAVLAILVLSREMLEKWPQSRELVQWLQGSRDWIGVVSLVIGLINLIRVLTRLKYFGYAPGIYLLWLASSLVMAALGLLLGQNLLRHFAASNPKAVDLINKAVDKLAPHQKNLGYGAAILAVLMLLMWIF